MKSNIFGEHEHAISFEPSRKEQVAASAEDWSAAILSGSNTNQVIEEPMRPSFVRWLWAGIGVVAAVLVLQLVNLQIVNGAHNQTLADGNRIRTRFISAPRGVMYDRNHNVVVQNLANFDLTVTPSLLPTKSVDRQQDYQLVGGLLGQDPAQIKKIAEAKGLTASNPVVVAENIPRDRALSMDERSRDMPGFSLDTTPSRQYLDGGTLSPFLGYIGRVSPTDLKTHPNYRPTDYIGKGGLESYYESQLRGQDGKEQTEVDAAGKPVRLLASTDPQPGNNLILSIDQNLQQKTAQILAAGIQKAGAHAGVALAMNPQTGEILAAVSYPGYDNNLFAKGISNTDYQNLLNNPDKPLFNRITQGAYPIGSTIKPMLSSAALQEGVINTSTTIVDQGKITVPNIYNPSIVQIFKSWDSAGLGPMNVLSALQWSSDIFFYTVGGGYQNFHGLGITRIDNYLAKFGFGKKTGIDLPSESSGYVPSPDGKMARQKDSWNIGDTYNVSIGQGDLLVTPLQLLNATNAVANGGTVYRPHLVRQIDDASGKLVKTIDPQVEASGFISPQNLAIVRQGMAQAVSAGTACCSIKAEVPVPVAGKTGTAETSTQDANGQSATKPHAWFTAYAPLDNPQISVVVLVENSGEGAEWAVPIGKDILKAYFIH